MKKALRIVLIGSWILLASGLLTRWWLTSDTARSLPRLPESFWLTLHGIFDVHTADDAMAVVTDVTLGLSLVIVSTLTWLALRLWRRISNRANKRA